MRVDLRVRCKRILIEHCPSADDLFKDPDTIDFYDRIMSAMEEYAKECVKASLERASAKCGSDINTDENIVLL